MEGFLDAISEKKQKTCILRSIRFICRKGYCFDWIWIFASLFSCCCSACYYFRADLSPVVHWKQTQRQLVHKLYSFHRCGDMISDHTHTF